MDYSIFFEPGFIIEALIVIGVVAWQIISYSKNSSRMDDYKNLFGNEGSWEVERDGFGQVTSITGGGSNRYFIQIKDTINKYIAGNSNSVMEFDIFKDAVDRQCDSIESQIESQNPVPLYLGLAGSMIGIIIGLFCLVFNGTFSGLVSEETAQAAQSAGFNGIASLLVAVAVAMGASCFGVVLTTLAAHSYKDKKSDAESGKNQFISWMQSVLLPELPNDMSFAMTQLVADLEHFNETFETNTKTLSQTFDNVNETYKTQAEIIKAVRDMDFGKMADANIKVLTALQTSTEKLERFNDYLDQIQGYTTTIQRFNEQFQQEENQLGLLKEIRDFFKTELSEIEQRKNAIGDAVSSVDLNLKKSFEELQNSSNALTSDFNKQVDEQKQMFVDILAQQKEDFQKALDEIKEKYEESIKGFPDIISKLNQISNIPAELQKLTSALQDSIRKASKNNGSVQVMNEPSEQAPVVIQQSISKKTKIFAACIAAILLFSCIFCCVSTYQTNAMFSKYVEAQQEQTITDDSGNTDTQESMQNSRQDSVAVPTIKNDSI